MENSRFDSGTVIKGRELRGCILCKILSKNMVMKGFQYKIGMNEDVHQLDLDGSYGMGLHFIVVQDVCRFLDYGTKLAIVSVPDKEDVYVDKGKFRTHRLEIKSVLSLDEVKTWELLVGNGTDITADNSYAVIWAAGKGYLDVVKYLHNNGADIAAGNNDAIIYAAKEGYLDMVLVNKYVGIALQYY